MLTRLQMGVHEEELVWLEKRVKAIKDASGSGITLQSVPHGDATSDSHGCICATTADLTAPDMTAD